MCGIFIIRQQRESDQLLSQIAVSYPFQGAYLALLGKADIAGDSPGNSVDLPLDGQQQSIVELGGELSTLMEFASDLIDEVPKTTKLQI